MYLLRGRETAAEPFPQSSRAVVVTALGVNRSTNLSSMTLSRREEVTKRAMTTAQTTISRKRLLTIWVERSEEAPLSQNDCL